MSQYQFGVKKPFENENAPTIIRVYYLSEILRRSIPEISMGERIHPKSLFFIH
jgi:hypothetical protein